MTMKECPACKQMCFIQATECYCGRSFMSSPQSGFEMLSDLIRWIFIGGSFLLVLVVVFGILGAIS